jgi:hypothetical protein
VSSLFIEEIEMPGGDARHLASTATSHNAAPYIWGAGELCDEVPPAARTSHQLAHIDIATTVNIKKGASPRWRRANPVAHGRRSHRDHSTLICLAFGAAACAFGMCTTSTPSLLSHRIASALMFSGSEKLREKLPWKLSTR